jgi:hypothetical protein
VPENVVEHYPNVDLELLGECRSLVLAMVAAWRWDPADQLPNGRRAARDLVSVLREAHLGRLSVRSRRELKALRIEIDERINLRMRQTRAS